MRHTVLQSQKDAYGMRYIINICKNQSVSNDACVKTISEICISRQNDEPSSVFLQDE